MPHVSWLPSTYLYNIPTFAWEFISFLIGNNDICILNESHASTKEK